MCVYYIVGLPLLKGLLSFQRMNSRAYIYVQAASSSRSQTTGNVTFSGGEKGQAVTTMLAAYAYNSYPLMMDLTDGKVG